MNVFATASLIHALSEITDSIDIIAVNFVFI